MMKLQQLAPFQLITTCIENSGHFRITSGTLCNAMRRFHGKLFSSTQKKFWLFSRVIN
uniref:THO complex 1 n=1 Tax=Myotis myotis TaxID=51298 RepID=A0A7J7W115_MYOMY|nr:THO complex 1 [Myotis myotis]